MYKTNDQLLERAKELIKCSKSENSLASLHYVDWKESDNEYLDSFLETLEEDYIADMPSIRSNVYTKNVLIERYNYDDNDSDTEYNSENDLYNLSNRVNNIEKNIVDLNITIKNMWSYIKQSNQIGSGLN